jgi:hypothetical protein
MGEDDQKLAKGIILCSISSENCEKPTVIGKLIEVYRDFYYLVSFQLDNSPVMYGVIY